MAWGVLGVTGLALATEHGWSPLLVGKTILSVTVVLMAVGHVWLGTRTGSRPALIASRTLAALVLAGTLLIFWLGVNVA